MEEVVEQLSAQEVVRRELNSLRGRLCTVIESAGMPHKQERAIIMLIKNLSFQNQNVLERVVNELDGDRDGNPRTFTVVNNRLK